METVWNIMIAGFFLMAAYGFYLMITGKDPEARLKKEVRRLKQKNRNKAPVIYLRSFEAEKIHFSDVRASFTGKVIPGSTAYWKDAGNIVTGLLSVIGPVRAIKRPYRSWIWRPAAPERPETVSVDDAHWQEKILEWLEEAVLVVIQLDATQGLLWEIDQVAQLVAPTRILLVLPPTKDEYLMLRESISTLPMLSLPEKLPESRILTFGPGWKPLPLQPHTGSIAALWLTLEPVFDQNGFEKPDWDYIYDREKPVQSPGTNNRKTRQ